MGKSKSEDERNAIYKEIFAAWQSMYDTQCKESGGVARSRCYRRALEQIEDNLVKKYGDFPELKDLIFNLFNDKSLFKKIAYNFGVKFDIFNDLAVKSAELKSLDYCSQFLDEAEFFACIKKRCEDIEYYGLYEKHYPRRDVENFITQYLFMERAEDMIKKAGYVFGMVPPPPLEGGGRRRSHKKTKKNKKTKKTKKTRKTRVRK